MERKDLIQEICRAAVEKKAADIVVMDITQMSVIADDFIICSGSSKAQVKAICDNIEEKLQKNAAGPHKLSRFESHGLSLSGPRAALFYAAPSGVACTTS